MRKTLLIAIAAVFAAGASLAGQLETTKFSITTTAGSVSVTNQVKGWIESVYVDLGGSITSTVALASSTETIWTGAALVADTVVRPRVDAVDATNAVESASLRADVIGDLIVTTSASTTNQSVEVTVTYEKGR